MSDLSPLSGAMRGICARSEYFAFDPTTTLLLRDEGAVMLPSPRCPAIYMSSAANFFVEELPGCWFGFLCLGRSQSCLFARRRSR
jgi:hypothetical protein